MKFGRELKRKALRDWRLFYLNYDELKQLILELTTQQEPNEEDAKAAFFELFDQSVAHVFQFVAKKQDWCANYLRNLEERTSGLDETGQWDYPETISCDSISSVNVSASDVATTDSDSDDEDTHNEPVFSEEQLPMIRSVKQYLYAKKLIQDFERELRLLQEFSRLNQEGIRKILKKFDKYVGSSIKDETLAALKQSQPGSVLWNSDFKQMLAETSALSERIAEAQPNIHWEGRKVLTVGCFDVFHHAHENLLMMMREFGTYVVVGVHDDESYFKLKNKRTIHNTLQRVQNVKKFADMVFVIPDTDPTEWIKAMVSEQDIKDQLVCYVRGEDMLEFPGREYVESQMQVYFVPRTEGVSSTLLRTIYHNENEEQAGAAAFADTDATGKPILEQAKRMQAPI